jgi:Holliday junction resolvase RusA-like endonuclease
MTEPHHVFSADALVMSDTHGAILLDLEVQGEPRVQERARVLLKNSVPRIYDPSARLKADFSRAVEQALISIGLSDFPLFMVQPLKVSVVFNVANMGKDIDNLLKFVMDTLQKLVYNNDRSVHFIECVKHHSPADGSTSIKVEPFVVSASV